MNKQHAGEHVQQFNFAQLFIEELGWNNPQSKVPETVSLNDANYALTPIAEKRGVQIFCCRSQAGAIPSYAVRQKIEREITKRVFEHLIIYVDARQSMQIWQWVAREKGKPAAYREYAYHAHQSPDAIVSKFEHIAFSLSDEEGLTLTLAVVRLKDAFDREKLTKKFYERFQKEHKAFLAFIKGLERETDRQWYASLMLNRLMFVYFIQKKGFLDGNLHYLRDRLKRVQAQHGKGNFHSFYRAFLLRLFHEGLAKPKREWDKTLEGLLGEVPYLNGGLFEPHQLESAGHDIKIADEAFEAIFNFFDEFDWTLDTRATSKANEINPDVLGHIFEKYINQKQMGAYYTKEDITEYITKSTVIPYLFQYAARECPIAFEPGRYAWSLIQADPDRYIFDALKKGVEKELPKNISVGLDDPSKRVEWNKAAPTEFGLPTETWREVVERRRRYGDVLKRIRGGEINTIDEFITCNLDIRQFARDVIQYAEGPELVRAFWKAIEAVTVLDPTCGSGAFLFAALNILYDLYDACLDRMEEFVRDAIEDKASRAPKYDDFRKILDQISQHPNRDYFIYKAIIVRNLYGVDIMDEAVEICKLRLFLKLAAQLESVKQIEPLPDIDFNIRPGNTLVGYATLEDARKAVRGGYQQRLLLDDSWSKIEEAAKHLDSAFGEFRRQQTELGGKVTTEDKRALREKLKALEGELNIYLAKDYGLKFNDKEPANRAAFEKWLAGHKPFHWLIEFYGTMRDGGFDVVIGNPPYLEYSKVRETYRVKNLETEDCGNLYGYCTEASLKILRNGGFISLIVPLSIFSTPNMISVKNYVRRECGSVWVSNYSNRPDQLFEGAQNFLCIFIGHKGQGTALATTGLRRWSSEFRNLLFDTLAYARVEDGLDFPEYSFPKFSDEIENKIWRKMSALSGRIRNFASPDVRSNRTFTYCYGGVYWTKARDFESPVVRNGKKSISTADRPVNVRDDFDPRTIAAILNSSAHFWFWTNFSDCRNKTYNVMLDMPSDEQLLRNPKFVKLAASLMADYKKNAQEKVRDGKNHTRFTEYYPKMSKPLIDEIDNVLGGHLHLTSEELDFIENYDIKFRLGADEDGDEE